MHSVEKAVDECVFWLKETEMLPDGGILFQNTPVVNVGHEWSPFLQAVKVEEKSSRVDANPHEDQDGLVNTWRFFHFRDQLEHLVSEEKAR